MTGLFLLAATDANADVDDGDDDDADQTRPPARRYSTPDKSGLVAYHDICRVPWTQ